HISHTLSLHDALPIWTSVRLPVRLIVALEVHASGGDSTDDRRLPDGALDRPLSSKSRAIPTLTESTRPSAHRRRLSFRSFTRSHSWDELLAAVDVVRRAGERRVGHDVHGECRDVGRSDHAPDWQRRSARTAGSRWTAGTAGVVVMIHPPGGGVP